MADTWFRLYNALLDNPKVQRLLPVLFKAWVNLLCLASRCGGKINPADVDFALRTKEGVGVAWLKTLAAEELFHEDGDGLYVPHDWDTLQYRSDVSTERVKRFRQRSTKPPTAVSATPPEQSRTETEQNRPDVGKVIEGVSKILKRESTWTPEQRKQAWQSRICNEAHRTMREEEYAKFLIAWANNEPWARNKAEEIDAGIKRERARA